MVPFDFTPGKPDGKTGVVAVLLNKDLAEAYAYNQINMAPESQKNLMMSTLRSVTDADTLLE